MKPKHQINVRTATIGRLLPLFFTIALTPLHATVTSVGVDSTAGANWRTGAALETDSEYGTLGYVVFGLNAPDNQYIASYFINGGTSQAGVSNPLNSVSLPAGIGITGSFPQIGMWAGNGNFGQIQDPGNANALTSTPLLANLTAPNQFTISRSTATSYRITLMTASGDGDNTTYAPTVNDGSGPASTSYTHTVNGLAYHVFDVSAGISNIVINLTGVARSLTGIAFDAVPPIPMGPALTWVGGTSAWNTSTSGNWKLTADNSPAIFANSPFHPVLFDDTATTRTVDISTGNVTPFEVTCDTTAGYTLQGSNGIAGFAGLTKSGSGTLTLLNDNTYTGTTTINDGILTLDGASQLGGGSYLGPIANDGIFEHNSTADQTLGGVISGSGSLAKSGTGILTLSAANTYTGNTTVTGGTLLVSGGGLLGSGATTVSGSSSILDLDRNDAWGNHSSSVQALTIQTGGLVTNGNQINRGFNTVQTLALDGGELRASGTARAIADGDLFKFEAYSISGTVTVTGTTASSITNPGTVANAGINIGGFTDLGGGLGSDLTFDVADVTISSAADLTVSAVLKNNYTFYPEMANLTNGLMKTGDGTLELTAANRYTGKTTAAGGTLILGQAFLADAADVEVTTGATLQLDFVGADVIDEFLIDGLPQTIGTWGRTNHPTAEHTSSLITGDGLLDVTTGPPSSGYASWASGFLPAFTNTAADLDFENDGLASGIEWVVGGDPTLNDAASVAPTFNNTTDPDDFLFTFRRRDTANTDPGTTIVVEYGSDLTGWTAAQNGVNGVSIDDTTDLGGGFHQVTVAIPRALAGGSGKLFARLRVAVVTP